MQVLMIASKKNICVIRSVATMGKCQTATGNVPYIKGIGVNTSVVLTCTCASCHALSLAAQTTVSILLRREIMTNMLAMRIGALRIVKCLGAIANVLQKIIFIILKQEGTQLQNTISVSMSISAMSCVRCLGSVKSRLNL
jgi:hypothetical protein